MLTTFVNYKQLKLLAVQIWHVNLNNLDSSLIHHEEDSKQFLLENKTSKDKISKNRHNTPLI